MLSARTPGTHCWTAPEIPEGLEAASLWAMAKRNPPRGSGAYSTGNHAARRRLPAPVDPRGRHTRDSEVHPE